MDTEGSTLTTEKHLCSDCVTAHARNEPCSLYTSPQAEREPRIKRDWARIERHIQVVDSWDVESSLSRLVTRRRLAFVRLLLPYLGLLGIKSILDVGCAGITRSWWIKNEFTWAGLAFPKDAGKLRQAGIDVDVGDVASMPYRDGQFDLVYASHVLEHSIMPLISLMECARVGTHLVMSTPKYPNHLRDAYHYAVVPKRVWVHWIRLTDWFVAADFSNRRDYRFLCVRGKDDRAKVREMFLERKRLKEERAKAKKAQK